MKNGSITTILAGCMGMALSAALFAAPALAADKTVKIGNV